MCHMQHGLNEKKRSPFFGDHFSNSGARWWGLERRGQPLDKGEDDERQWEALTELDSGVGKGCHYSKWEITRRYQFGEGRCGSTFNNLSSSCCGMLRRKCPAGGWHCATAVRREAGLSISYHLKPSVINSLSVILSRCLLTSKPDITVFLESLRSVCLPCGTYPLFTAHLRTFQETSHHPHWMLFLIS